MKHSTALKRTGLFAALLPLRALRVSTPWATA